MTFESNRFDMGSVMNKLRAIAEAQPETVHHDPGMEVGGQEIDNASFTRTMQRIAAIKDAVAEENYNALRAGIRSLYMNRRPNLQQMSALMDLLETVLSYVAEDNALFQRLKSDLAKDKTDQEADTGAPAAGQTTAQAPEIGAPATAEPVKQADMRALKV